MRASVRWLSQWMRCRLTQALLGVRMLLPHDVAHAEGTGPRVVVSAVGDVGFRRQVGIDVARGQGDPFSHVRSVLQAADLRFANLESVLTVRPLPSPKTSRSYPIIKGPPQGAEALSRAGFDVVSVANNHIFDFFAPGFDDTLKSLARVQIAAVGAGKNDSQAYAPHISTVKGVRIGWLAYASGVNRPAHGDAVVARRWGPAPIAAVRKLRSQVDVLLVSVHWGQEGKHTPIPKQTQFAHALIDAGVDVVIGHHPHVLQSVEVYRDRPIFYSLGNFLFGKQPKVRRMSAILTISIGTGSQPIHSALLTPVLIDEATEVPMLATGSDADEIVETVQKISRGLGAKWQRQQEQLELVGSWTVHTQTTQR